MQAPEALPTEDIMCLIFHLKVLRGIAKRFQFRNMTEHPTTSLEINE